jgi:simple sugar transport system permease protein
MGIATILIGMFIFFTFTIPDYKFLDVRNLNAILRITPELAIVAVGATILIICQEFDLSVGTIFGFGALVMTLLTTNLGINPFISLVVGIVTGAGLGVFNGLITTKLRMPSFVVTLGTSMLWRGVILILCRGYPIVFRPERLGAENFVFFMVGEFDWFPIQTVWLVLITAGLWVILEHTRFGNWVFATGGNRDAARAMGINTDRVKILAWALMGGICAFAGSIQNTRVHSFSANMGSALGLEVIAAYVIGGTSLTGGVGTVVGTLIGMFLVRIIEVGLLMLRVPSYWFQAFIGAMIVIGVAFNLLIDRVRG